MVKQEESVTRLKWSAVIGIIALAAMGMSQGAVSPGLARFAEIWPQYNAHIALINTLPSLIAIPASLLSGRLADKGILTYKQLAIIGMIIATVGGVAPMVLFGSFPVLLICRACFGMGLGLFQPVANSVILLIVPGERARHYMSISSAASNMGGILFQTVGGLLCDVSPRLSFATYFICGISALVILFCLPNPPRAVSLPKHTGKAEPMGYRVFGWATLNLFFSGCFFIMTNIISMVVINNDLGTAADAALALSLFTLGGFAGSVLSSHVFRLLRVFTLTFACLLPAAGYTIMIFSNSMLPIYIGAFIFGIGFGCWNPTLQTFGGRSVPASCTSTALSLIMCFAGVGNFLSAYFVNFLSQFFPPWDRFGFAVGVTIFLIMAAILFGYGLRHRKQS